MRAGAEDDQPQIAHMRDEHALVDQERIRLPGRIRTGSTKVIDAALFECADPGYFSALIEMPVEQQPFAGIVDDTRAVLLDLRRKRDLCNRDNRAARQS